MEKLNGNLSWDHCFEQWRQNEAINSPEKEEWERHFKERGFQSWQEWRQTYVEKFQLATRNWTLFLIENPLERIPEFYAGPFKGIQDYIPYAPEITFEDLAALTEIQTNRKMNAISLNFPDSTILIGVKKENSQDAMILEGTHRCCAIALLKRRRRRRLREKTKLKVYIALSTITEKEWETTFRLNKFGFPYS